MHAKINTDFSSVDGKSTEMSCDTSILEVDACTHNVEAEKNKSAAFNMTVRHVDNFHSQDGDRDTESLAQCAKINGSACVTLRFRLLV